MTNTLSSTMSMLTTSRDPRADLHLDLGTPLSARDRKASLRACPTLGADVWALGRTGAGQPVNSVPAMAANRVGSGFAVITSTPMGTSVSSPPI